ncbi:MAG: tRNA (adenosine(37)-N6)-threonylcarbamoyltransferase complex dimerization subunit type 1 TsaB [Rhodospirillaceae bacterium]|nr:tRNA (adenosine(37)-N6)-threonylcarbamoyltransferase complex dimerization subunit type 1 TsaB [Rhodospirillaceae bacterium]|tara:strand:- start:1649 stop:2341 length:693 start_codon:yes stop_codon:yes gene_type:complete
MKILGIDSTLGFCSAAVLDQNNSSKCFNLEFEGHSEMLIPIIQKVMEEADLPFHELNLIAVTVGPGSFTGLRAGLSAAKGLGLALDIPVHGVTTLEAVAFGARSKSLNKGSRNIAVALDTKRDEIYFQNFNAESIAKDKAIAGSVKDIIELLPLGPLSLCGDAAERLFANVPVSRVKNINCLNNIGTPNAKYVAKIAVDRMENPLSASPLYINPAATKQPKDKNITRPWK